MNNTPAFPNPHLRDDSGMTLRDYFAAKAMQAILSNPEYGDDDTSLAGAAYYVADAMMKAREA
jgi:hypothetical protein